MRGLAQLSDQNRAIAHAQSIRHVTEIIGVESSPAVQTTDSSPAIVDRHCENASVTQRAQSYRIRRSNPVQLQTVHAVITVPILIFPSQYFFME